MSSLASVNLNLLVALDALLELKGVGRAAQRLGVTQSAMSHTLRQLRQLFDDPLLVRAGRRMVLTPRAASLSTDLRAALSVLEGVVTTQGPFDPSRYAGRKTLATQDGVLAAFADPLFRMVRNQAPLAEVAIVRPPDDLALALEDGRVDLASGPPVDVPAGLEQVSIPGTETSWSVICWDQHELAELDLDAFCSLPHAAMSLTGEGPSFVDHALGRLGRSRQIAARIPFLLALPYVLPGTDMISVVVTPAAQQFVAKWPLKRFDCPIALPGPPMRLLWHARYNADPAHRWFRQTVQAAAESLAGGGSG